MYSTSGVPRCTHGWSKKLPSVEDRSADATLEAIDDTPALGALPSDACETCTPELASSWLGSATAPACWASGSWCWASHASSSGVGRTLSRIATDARRGCVGGLAMTRGGMREMRRSACERCAKMALLLLTLDEAMVGDGDEEAGVDSVRDLAG